MKILFVFGGIPHYLHSLLDKLNSNSNLEIEVIIPEKGGNSIGKGVKLSNNQTFSFSVVKLEEYTSWSGKLYFKHFGETLKNLQPNILVIGWPYIVSLSFDIKTLCYIKKKDIKLIYREIPFQVAPFDDVISYYKKYPAYNEDMVITSPSSTIKFYLWAILLGYVRKWYYSLADATLNYAPSANDIQPSYGVSSNRIFVAGNSPDTDTLFAIKENLLKQTPTIENHPFRLIHVGRLVKWKRVDLLCYAVEKLKNDFPQIELLVIGDGPEKENLKNLTKQLSIENHVDFIDGTYNTESLGRYLLSSAIYVLAGMGGLSINEAMAFGKPIICSVCDGTEKLLVKDGYNGLYFKEGDVESLTQKISLLLSDSNLVRLMGQHSEQIIQQDINLETVCQKYIDAFNFVIGK